MVKRALLVALEITGVAAVVVGVALVSLAGAFCVAGVAAVAIVELRPAPVTVEELIEHVKRARARAAQRTP